MRELGVTVPVVVQMMRGARRWKLPGAQLQRKRLAGRGHEPHGYIGPERERKQQEPGDQVTAAAMERTSLHKP